MILIKELISKTGILSVHVDYHKSYQIRCILDEIFSKNMFVNEIVWHYKTFHGQTHNYLPRKHDSIFIYSKSSVYNFNMLYDTDFNDTGDSKRWSSFFNNEGCICGDNMPMQDSRFIRYLDKWKKNNNGKIPGKNDIIYRAQGQPIDSVWEMKGLDPKSNEKNGYPTQKPEHLIERILNIFSNPGSLVFDCFMGSGTTQAVAMKLGRRFIGADINLGAIQTTTKRLNNIITEKIRASPDSLLEDDSKLYLNFEVYNVNNYDVFRNPVQAREVLLQALEIEPLATNDIFDGMKDGYKVKIMPINRIATRADLNSLLNGINYRELDRQIEISPGKPAEHIMLVCMGHEPDLAENLKKAIGLQYKLDIKVVDILRDQKDLTFTYDSEADIVVENGELFIRQFYPRNLLQKLSILEENVEDWRQLVETVAIDWNYNGDVLQPALYDNPGKNELVQGRYPVPHDYGIIRVKITDLLSESLEMTLEVK